jgi:hypothetical protein
MRWSGSAFERTREFDFASPNVYSVTIRYTDGEAEREAVQLTHEGTTMTVFNFFKYQEPHDQVMEAQGTRGVLRQWK